MKKVLTILLVAIMMMVVFVSVAFAAAPDPEYPAALDAEDTSAEVISAADEPPDVWDFIKPEAYILIPVLYIIGLFVKKAPKAPDWIIPFILLAFGIVGGGIIIGWTPVGIIQGILIAGFTVFGNQAIKQLGKGITGSS